MTDEPVNENTEATSAPIEAEHQPALRSEPEVERPTWWNRFLSPLLVPIAVVAVIGFFVLSISRMFLAAEGTLAVIFGTLLTAGVLLGAALLADSELKGSSMAVIMIGVFAFVALFGMVSIGDAEPDKAEEVAQCEPIEFELPVVAGPGLKYDKKAYEVQAGCVNVALEDLDNAHDLTWDPGGPQMPKLVNTASFATTMAPGEYVFFCSVAGHRAGGMEATVTVTG